MTEDTSLLWFNINLCGKGAMLTTSLNVSLSLLVEWKPHFSVWYEFNQWNWKVLPVITNVPFISDHLSLSEIIGCINNIWDP